MKTQTFHAVRHEAGIGVERQDPLAVEAALQIKINGQAWTTTMRTPGEDRFLARGLLFTEGVVPDPGAEIEHREILDPETNRPACLELAIAPGHVAPNFATRRSAISTSSCGICGTREAADLIMEGAPLRVDPSHRLDIERVPEMFAEMEKRQDGFVRCGGLHAAAIFDSEGRMLAAFEDIGRHNAVDKAIGKLIEDGALERASRLTISGRLSYEIVLKAFRARTPFILAVSAPSSLAVEMAQRFGMTTIGFCRGRRATVYSNPQNIISAAGAEASKPAAVQTAPREKTD